MTSPPQAATAQRYVAASMRSGITICSTQLRLDPAETAILLSPAPFTFAPIFCKNFCRSTISGSLAALIIRVVPEHAVAASIMFSVAPTLGNPSTISLPFILSAIHSISPPRTLISTPNLDRASKCKSIGLGPSSHPPGALSCAFPHRAIIGPKNMTDDLISRIKSSGTSYLPIVEESTITVLPSLFILQPRCFNILIADSTSFSSVQLCIIFSPALSSVAARIGKTLFLAPFTVAVPFNLLPPSTAK